MLRTRLDDLLGGKHALIRPGCGRRGPERCRRGDNAAVLCPGTETRSLRSLAIDIGVSHTTVRSILAG